MTVPGRHSDRSSDPGRRMCVCQRMYAGAPAATSKVSAHHPTINQAWLVMAVSLPLVSHAVAATASDVMTPL